MAIHRMKGASHLTARETEVLRLHNEGKTLKEISAALGVKIKAIGDVLRLAKEKMQIA